MSCTALCLVPRPPPPKKKKKKRRLPAKANLCTDCEGGYITVFCSDYLPSEKVREMSSDYLPSEKVREMCSDYLPSEKVREMWFWNKTSLLHEDIAFS